MRFSIVAAALFSSLALAVPSQKGFEVVIHYVDAPDCDVQCGANTTSIEPTTSTSSTSTTSEEQTTTYTSTSTKYVIVTLQTGYGSTETLGYETATTVPTPYETAAPEPEPTY
ncbi:hypothetical protein TWF506_007333 [Arthrobotrys conoides]|uniref:Uncharacterized protein n=1 Tax=Arthrobotrys conoides TaxID=74498 RepID=A0AAN8NFJ0_9PEZI